MYARTMPLTEVQEIKPVVLFIRWLRLVACLGVAAPDDQDTADESARVAHSWGGDLARRLQQRR